MYEKGPNTLLGFCLIGPLFQVRLGTRGELLGTAVAGLRPDALHVTQPSASKH